MLFAIALLSERFLHWQARIGRALQQVFDEALDWRFTLKREELEICSDLREGKSTPAHAEDGLACTEGGKCGIQPRCEGVG